MSFSPPALTLPANEEEIVSNWIGTYDHPLVSIKCITYNHFPFIEQAIRGFLAQKTTFPFEVWIHDDASTDGTDEIIKKYQKKYPKVIKSVLQEENQYSKLNKPANILQGFMKGKYIAVCEGDDYWTDPLKLQKQVEFLEKNPDFAISSHDAFIIDEFDEVVSRSKLPASHKRDYSARELAEGKAWILTLGWVYRRIENEFPMERNMVRNGDTFFTSMIGGLGKSHYHTDIKPAVYRIHPGGNWSALDNEKKLEAQTNTWFWMYQYYKRIGKIELANVFHARFKRNVMKQMSLVGLLKAVIHRLFFIDKIKALIMTILGPDKVIKIKKVLGRI